MERYASLHTHSEYSNLRMLDCINKIPNLVQRAVELNCTGLALTDHESLSGHIAIMNEIKKEKELDKIDKDFKLMLGNEIYLIDEVTQKEGGGYFSPTPYYHFILIAKDAIGHEQLRILSSLAWKNSYYTGRMERVPTLKKDLYEVVSKNKGHLVAQNACLGGELAKLILENRDYKSFINWCLNLFGGDFYLEIQPSVQEDQSIVNKKILELSKEFSIPFVITCDAHYLSKEDRFVHEAYLNSREEEGEYRELGDFYATTYMMGTHEIHEYLDDIIGVDNVTLGLSNTNLIADKCEEYSLDHKQIVPKVPIPKFTLDDSFSTCYDECEYIKKFAYSDDERDRYFLHLIIDGWWDKEYRDDLDKETIHKMMFRINDELETIWKTSEKLNDNVASYYLTAKEIVNMMWDEGDSLVGCSRGSIASFYTAYLIGISQINSFEHNIPYWRHLHYCRPDMPDVDVDSEKSKRSAIIKATRKKFGEDKVLNICTFKTEGSRSSLLTACRGLGIDNDTAQYLANMIPVVRGFTTSLKVMVNGNPETGEKPQTEFINECGKYGRLLDTALSLEGLVSGRSIHASGVIIFEDPYTVHNCLMKAPSGQWTTQWSMHDSEQCGGLKYDFLTITNLDVMRQCFNMLLESGHIKWQGSLRKTWNHYFSPNVIDYDSEDMWKMVENHEIINLFQMDSAVGRQAVQKIKPRSLKELGVANAVMRLMSQDGSEQPLDVYVKYKNDLSKWYLKMQEYHLTDNEIKVIERHLKDVCGMATMQEEVMLLSMDKDISGFDLIQSNLLRKSIAKKNKKARDEAKALFFEKGKEQGTSDNLLNYVWNECITPQLGYSFSLPHILGYSTIAIQQMNMAYHYPIIYWNTANLIVDSGSLEESAGEDTSTDYGKLAMAIAEMKDAGVGVTLPLINEAKYQFIPDEENNRIIYSLKALCGIGDEAAERIIKYQPYKSLEDFCEKMIDTKLIKNAQMIALIKAGCFIEIDDTDRRKTMQKYLYKYAFTPAEKLGMSQFERAVSLNIIPEELSLAVRVKRFKDYVLNDCFFVTNIIQNSRQIPKRGYHDRSFKLDSVAMQFFKKYFTEECVIDVQGESFLVSEKKFGKACDNLITPLKQWFGLPETVDYYNKKLFEQVWNKYASGTVSKWEMDSLSFYYTEHELISINKEEYGIINFFELPTTPEPYDSYIRFINGEKKFFPKYEIHRVTGTVVDKNNDRHMITLITTDGVVNVKFNKGQYAFYNKRISQKVDENSDKKKVLEESWFKRGTKLVVSGYRLEDTFRAYRYTDSIYQHTVMKINDINDDGTLVLQTERTKI